MIDKRLFKLPKAKIMLAMLAGLMFLQAFAILGQGIFLARAIVGSWKQQPFTEIAQDVLLFFDLLFITARYQLVSKMVHEPLCKSNNYTFAPATT